MSVIVTIGRRGKLRGRLLYNGRALQPGESVSFVRREVVLAEGVIEGPESPDVVAEWERDMRAPRGEPKAGGR